MDHTTPSPNNPPQPPSSCQNAAETGPLAASPSTAQQAGTLSNNPPSSGPTHLNPPPTGEGDHAQHGGGAAATLPLSEPVAGAGRTVPPIPVRPEPVEGSHERGQGEQPVDWPDAPLPEWMGNQEAADCEQATRYSEGYADAEAHHQRLTQEGITAITGPATTAALKARYDQIVMRGHDAESDDMHPVGWLTAKAKFDAQVALDRINHRGSEDRDFTSAKTALARTAAYAMAEYDRLDRIEARATKGRGL